MPPNYNARRQFIEPIPALVTHTETAAKNVKKNSHVGNETATVAAQLTAVIAQIPDEHSTDAAENTFVNDHQNVDEISQYGMYNFELEFGNESTEVATENSERNRNENGHDDANNETAIQNQSSNYNEFEFCYENGASVAVGNKNENVPDTKEILPTVNVDEIDAFAMESVLCVGGEGDQTASEQTMQTPELPKGLSIVLEENETAELKDGRVIVTKRINEDLQMTYTYGEQPTILAPYYRVKLNDPVSEDIPFKENVWEINFLSKK